jgi:subtilisin-like proprotein convertase family protein
MRLFPNLFKAIMLIAFFLVSHQGFSQNNYKKNISGTNTGINLETRTLKQFSRQMFDSIMFIPDGPACPPGYYSSSMVFTVFDSALTYSNTNDLQSIVVSCEHSFAADLGFTLFCPNGQSIVLDGNDMTGSSIFLGIPNETDGSPLCDPNVNPPGTPWIYGWSQIYPTQGSLNVLDAGPVSPIPATDTINHAYYFIPDQSFSNLIGCPLNGQWNIQITDNWGSDNGYVFMWELNFDPTLLPTTSITTNVSNEYGEIKIYPNPASNFLQIDSYQDILSADISDVTGRVLISTDQKRIDCRSLTNGIYFIQIRTLNGIAKKMFVVDK